MGTSVRRPWETATVLDQALLDQSQDSLSQGLDMIVDVYAVDGVKRWSDGAKYVDSVFYENRVEFPTIERTIGEFLSGELIFSGLEITVGNTDKLYSNILPGGNAYDGWINRRVEVKIGLLELGSSYVTLFDGFVTDIGGFSRDVSTFTLTCRNKFDSVNVSIPNQVLLDTDFPDIEDEFIGLAVPVIYGDWTTDLRIEKINGLNAQVAAVPAFPVNGLDPLVNASLDPVDPGAGNTPLRLVFSSTPIKTLDTATVTLSRGDLFYLFAPGDIAIVPLTNNTVFDITQKNLFIDGSPWIYESGDTFFVKCVGVELSGGTYDSNIVEQSRDLLERFGGLISSDFTAEWDYFRDKNAPPQSAIANIPARVWFQDTSKLIDLVAALLEQVRLEPYINRLNKWALNSLHFDEFEAAPAFVVKNWDVGKGSFAFQIDERNNFNRATADFDFNPAIGESRFSTPIFRNDLAITQAGKQISKKIVFPNLYKIDDVQDQLIEMIRLVSGYSEFATVKLTSRAFLKDISDFVQLSIDIGSVEFSSTGSPIVGMIRDLSYDPTTMGINAKIWLFQMLNFPGYTGPTGTVSGYNQSITQET